MHCIFFLLLLLSTNRVSSPQTANETVSLSLLMSTQFAHHHSTFCCSYSLDNLPDLWWCSVTVFQWCNRILSISVSTVAHHPPSSSYDLPAHLTVPLPHFSEAHFGLQLQPQQVQTPTLFYTRYTSHISRTFWMGTLVEFCQYRMISAHLSRPHPNSSSGIHEFNYKLNHLQWRQWNCQHLDRLGQASITLCDLWRWSEWETLWSAEVRRRLSSFHTLSHLLLFLNNQKKFKMRRQLSITSNSRHEGAL